MSQIAWAAYSQRYLTAKLTPMMPYNLRRSVARGIRVLGYLQGMGSYVTIYQLARIGAGQWKVLRYIIPDLLADDLIDEVKMTRKKRDSVFSVCYQQSRKAASGCR